MLRHAAAALLLLVAGGSAWADPLTPEQKAAVERLIRDTLADHPEIVLDALKAAQAKEAAQSAAAARQAIVAQRSALVADPDSPVGGNPKGDVTIVEFFDYRCPYCKAVEPALEALLKEDGKLRIVYKEFPILGPASVYAARIALAARAQGRYEAFHQAMMGTKGTIDEATVLRTAATAGLDADRLKTAAVAPEIERIIGRNFDLAEAIDIQGTPAFIVGDTYVPGVVDIATLRKLIADTRKGG